MDFLLDQFQFERRNIVRACELRDFRLTEESRFIGYIYDKEGNYQKFYLEPGIKNLISFICSDDQDKLVCEAYSDYAIFNTLGKFLDISKLHPNDRDAFEDQLIPIRLSGVKCSFETICCWGMMRTGFHEEGCHKKKSGEEGCHKKKREGGSGMKNIVCSKWTRRVIWLLIIVAMVINYYILFFVGTGNTCIDEVCFVLELLFMLLQIARSIVKHAFFLKDISEVSWRR